MYEFCDIKNLAFFADKIKKLVKFILNKTKLFNISPILGWKATKICPQETTCYYYYQSPDSYLFVHYNIGICLLEKLDVDAHNLQIFKISSISSWTFSTSIGAFSISFPSKPPLSKHKPPWKILPFYLKWVGPWS